jgi:tetratricopeptide (TPR) repeat protein
MWRWVAFELAAFIAAAGAAAGQTRDEQWSRCNDPDPDRAIAGCTPLIQSGQERAADRAAAFNNRGIAYPERSDYDRAIEDFDQAIGLKPDFEDAFYHRANAYRRQGDLDSAIEDYDQAIKLKPDHGEALNHRGVAYWSKGDLDRAIQDFDQAVRPPAAERGAMDRAMSRAGGRRAAAAGDGGLQRGAALAARRRRRARHPRPPSSQDGRPAIGNRRLRGGR